ncbi:BrnT family toxin [Thermodesulfobacteriota bacterium B35]
MNHDSALQRHGFRRWITMGISKKGRLLIVCHTFQEENRDSVSIRIFSSRKATRKESDVYGR